MTNKYRLTQFFTLTLLAAAFGCQPDDSTPTGPDLSSDPAASSATEGPDLAVTAARWIARRDMPSSTRTDVAAAAVTKNGSSVLYVIGGETTAHHALGRVQAYHVATNSWTWHPDVPFPVTRSNGAVTINNKIYISGGTTGDHGELPTLFVFDPATNNWTRKHDMPEPSINGVSGVSNGKLYVLTQCAGEECIGTDTPQFYRYDPATDTWTTLPAPANSHIRGAGGFIGGKFYVAGGVGVGDSRQLDVYDPATNTWSTRAPLGRNRWDGAGLPYNGKLYLIGGYAENPDGSSTLVRTTTVYNPATDRWGTGAPLPTARRAIAGSRVVLNGVSRIEVVGGPAPGNNLSYQP
jgi:N-acetylneuraminic acid mutarotase